jgi:DNA-binding beta-propeller fold protein YncE
MRSAIAATVLLAASLALSVVSAAQQPPVPAVAGQAPAPPAQAPWHIDTSWMPIPKGAAAMWEMNGAAVDRDGRRVYATRRSDPPIVEIDGATGKVLREFGSGLLVWPHGITVDKDGFIWIADATVGDPPSLGLMPRLESALRLGRGHQVMKLNKEGKVLLELGTRGVAGTDAKTFNAPTNVAVAANGDIFVSDGHNPDTNARVVKFSKDGKFIKAWGKLGSNPGEFNVPHAIVIDSRGRVLVADRGNRRIQVFDSDGNFIAQWSGFGAPSGLAIGPDDTLFATSNRMVIIGSAKDGSVIGKVDGVNAEGIAADSHGNAYASEVFDRSVKKLSPDNAKTKATAN